MISGGECCYGSNTTEKFEISRGEGDLVICPQKSSGLMTGDHENYLVFLVQGVLSRKLVLIGRLIGHIFHTSELIFRDSSDIFCKG